MDLFSARDTDPNELYQCLQKISQLCHMTRKSSRSLIGNLSIIENKRAIAEAESVFKFTELAFFPIPSIFSASVLSMQVKELSSPDLSISRVAVVITKSSYTLRLASRSALFVGTCWNLMDQIKDYLKLDASSLVSIQGFILLLWD